MESTYSLSPQPPYLLFQRETDEFLVAAAKSGEHQAYAELFRRHSQRILRTAIRIVRNTEDAEDVVQESIMKAFAHLGSFDGRSQFSTWLTRIAINTALMMLRKRRNNPECSAECSKDALHCRAFEIAEPSRNPEDTLLQNEADLALRVAVNRLSASLKSVMEARHGRDASVREISIQLGISEAATKSRLLRGRAALQVAIHRRQLATASGRVTGEIGMTLRRHSQVC